MLSPEELEKIGENDINNYFQMSVEMFDYMDEILTLQEAGKKLIFIFVDIEICLFKLIFHMRNIVFKPGIEISSSFIIGRKVLRRDWKFQYHQWFWNNA